MAVTPDKQAAPSEWVEMAMELAETYAGNTSEYHHALRIDVGTHEAGATCEQTEAALRAHLESREALLEKERESRKEAQMENVRLRDYLARHGIEARAVLAKREALVKQLAEALQAMVGLWADESEFENETAAIQSARAALAAYQEKT